MKIKILEYHIDRGNKVKVQSHNKRNGKWIVNPKYEFHKRVAYNSERIAILDVKETEMEVEE